MPDDGTQALASTAAGSTVATASPSQATAPPPRRRAAGPLIPGTIGCVVIRPDGSRVLARVEPDPLAQ